MSDPGSEVPPEHTEGTTEGAWEPVQRPEAELPASTGQPFPPVGALPPRATDTAPDPRGYTGTYTGTQYAPPRGGPNVPPPPGGYPPPAGQAAMRPTTAAVLSYMTFIPAIVFLLIEPHRHDPLVRFHAFQELLLTAAWIAGDLVFSHLGWTGFAIKTVLHLVLFVGWVVGVIQASKGERYRLPILGELAESLSRNV